MAAPSHSTRNLAIWKELPRDLVETIVEMATDMIDDECCGDGQAACYFIFEVFNRPLPQSMIEAEYWA